MLICLAALLAIAPASAGYAKMSSSHTIGNQHIAREIALDERRLSTVSVGRSDNAVRTIGGDEFAVVLGPDGKRLTAADFRVTSVGPVQPPVRVRSLWVKLRRPGSGLEAKVRYYVGSKDSYMRKSLTLRNTGKSPVQVLDVEVESLRFASARAIGVGEPVYAANQLFLGLEFPLGENEEANGLVTLRHHPGKTLKPGESFTAKVAVIGAAGKGESAEEAFDRYVRRIALRKPTVMTIYGNWAVYDYLSDVISPDEQMVLRTTKELAALRKLGWRPDYYVMDAGWFDTKGDYTDYVKPAWPDGPKRMVDAITGLGIDYGLWFDVGGGIVNNPAMKPSRKGDGRLCLASEPYISTFENALLEQIRVNKLRMVKFDFATFTCDNDKHDHLLGEYAAEATLTSFLDMLDSVRRKHPDVKYIIFNGFHRSPWWLAHIDTIYTNDPAPSHNPSLRLRDSVNLRTDAGVHAHRFEYLLPWYCIDDCGLMIGKTGTIYWIGAEEWRKTWVLNIGRGGMTPFIYGDLGLLDDSDRRFLVKMWSVVRDNPAVFSHTQAILGPPNGNEVYGYSHFAGGRGYVFVNNPTFEVKSATIKLDASIGLNFYAGMRLSVSELFPVERPYALDDKRGFRPGSDLTIELAPFEVRAIEVKPGVTPKSAQAPGKAAYSSVAIPVTLERCDPAWVTDSTLGMLNDGLQRLAGETGREAEKIDRRSLESSAGVYSCEVQLPEFDGPRTLALPVRFIRDGHPHAFNDPTNRIVPAAWSDAGQIFLRTTPEYGRKIWSRCSWVTFHAALAPALSGKKVHIAAVTYALEGAAVTLDKAYLLDVAR